jgi:hypothetical protein
LFLIAGTAAGITLVLAVESRVWQRRRADGRSAGLGRPTALLSGLLVAATFIPVSVPSAAESATLSSRESTPLRNLALIPKQLEWGQTMRDRIGAETPVTYLTFGNRNYLLGNPSTCEFPTSVFLQRSRSIRKQEGTPTWEANLRCLTDKPGELLVWDPNWFLLRREPPVVQAAVARTFDCNKGFTLDRIQVCPRRV